MYPALIHKDRESDYGVSFPDVPGCVSAGSTPEEAHELAEEALQFHVDGMLEDGEPVSEPTTLTNAYTLAKEQGTLVVTMVPVRIPGKARRINVTMEENLLDEIDQAAAKRGMSRSGFLAEGARRLMGMGE